MSDPRKIDRADVVQVLWPTIGPHTAESIGTAAAAISELWRYLAHATRSMSIVQPADVCAAVDSLRVATVSAVQVLEQLHRWAIALSANPDLRHDSDGSLTADTACDTGYALYDAMLWLHQVPDGLDKAAQALGHLYLAADDAEETGR